MCVWIEIVERLAVEILIVTSLDPCLRQIFLFEREARARSPRQMEIFNSKTAINLMYANVNLLVGYRISLKGAVGDEYYLCRIEHQITIPAHTQAPILIRSQGTWIMMDAIHHTTVERQCLMNTRFVIKSFTWKAVSRPFCLR